MDVPARIQLKRLLISNYDGLVRRLTARLGSSDLAREAVQDTFLRLERLDIGPVGNPEGYLYRMAVNAAADRRTSELRQQKEASEDTMLRLSDDAPSPERAAMARSEIEALKAALRELPERRRHIALSIWGEKASHRELAEHYGVSVRIIQSELRSALDHCAKRLNRGVKKASSPPVANSPNNKRNG